MKSSPQRPPRPAPRRPRRTALPEASLVGDFDRLKEVQTVVVSTSIARRRPPGLRNALLSVLALTLIVTAVIVGPVIYRGTQAYRDVFEDPVPRTEEAFTVALNPEGTAVVVETTATAVATIPPWDGKERITLLLLGIDRREDEPTRSDTMILVNIDPIAKTASMLSIPRDLKVVIPGYGAHKINAAYAFGDADNLPGGGPGLTINTIEANFGITINYYAQIDFHGFVNLVDTAGGITVDVPYPIKDDEYPGPGNQYMRIFFKPGWQHMDGARALQYARTRHDDGDGRRAARQQQVLLAIREQAVTLDLLPRAAELLGEFGDAIRTDLHPTQALQLARLGAEMDHADIQSFTLDGALYDQALPGEEYFIIADWSAVGVILSEFAGTTIIPPMSVLANSNFAIDIVIQDGTFNPGLGGRLAAVLTENGFANVTVTDKPDLGNYPISSITTDTESLSTAYLIARLIGLDLNAISVDDSLPISPAASVASPTQEAGTPAANRGGLFPTATGDSSESTGLAVTNARLVIVVGDDAPDPAYFTVEPFTE